MGREKQNDSKYPHPLPLPEYFTPLRLGLKLKEEFLEKIMLLQDFLSSSGPLTVLL